MRNISSQCSFHATQGVWQKAKIGVALVGNDATLLETRLSQIMRFMEGQHLADIADSQVELCYLKD